MTKKEIEALKTLLKSKDTMTKIQADDHHIKIEIEIIGDEEKLFKLAQQIDSLD